MTAALVLQQASEAFSLFANNGLAERMAMHPLQRRSTDSQLAGTHLAGTSSLFHAQPDAQPWLQHVRLPCPSGLHP